MQLTNYLTAEQVLPGCEARDKGHLLALMVARALQSRQQRLNPDVTAGAVLEAIMAREAERPTTMGNGMAFPHARLAGFRGMAVALAAMKTPIDFGGGELVNVVCMIIVPQEAPMVTLRVMSRLTGFFRTEANRAALLAAASGEEVVRLLASGALSMDIPVTARDIMTAPGQTTLPEKSLREVSRVMHTHNLNVVPVVDASGRLLGEITCDLLFQFGLPDFFNQLKSVSFISEFDPFEKYFAEEAHSLAQRLMRTDLCRMPPEATLLEIVFALAVKRHSQVYVEDAQGNWVGTVDRDDVLNNVLNW
jgi:mannitol/fructose-specific phosphotransferase system IIA component (Ntr-type)/predicted transcriptional regulator